MEEMKSIEKEIAHLTEVVNSEDSIVREVKEALDRVDKNDSENERTRSSAWGLTRQEKERN